jgi:methylmalonyl-CoA mutase N-terminal domain/subunit
LEKDQKSKLAHLRQERDHALVNRVLQDLQDSARGNDNLMPVLLKCVEGEATLGEIAGALREVWGEYRPQGWF